MKNPSFPYPLYQIDVYDEREAVRDFDVAILTPHGGVAEPFLEVIEDFLNICYLSAEELIRLCRSERDTFTPELAAVVAKQLSAMGYRVGVFSALVPREMIDPNRVDGQGVKATFDFKMHPKWHARLRAMHQEILMQKDAFLAELSGAGRLLDLHSMRPNCFKEPLRSPRVNTREAVLPHLRERLRKLASPREWGVRRDVCVITETRLENGDREYIADPDLARHVGENLAHLGVAENQPYSGRPDIESVGSMRRARGVAVDVPKHLLSKEKAGQEYDLANLTPDSERIRELGESLAGAIDNTVEKIKAAS